MDSILDDLKVIRNCMLKHSPLTKMMDKLIEKMGWIKIQEGCEMPEIGEMVNVWDSEKPATVEFKIFDEVNPMYWYQKETGNYLLNITHWQRITPPTE